MMNGTLRLERREQAEPDPIHMKSGGSILITPPINEGYWSYRVRLTEHQAIVGFPKFTTVGIGFAAEEDWNTNLPYTSDAAEILAHIAHNKGDESISDEDCLRAIEMIQEAVQSEVGRNPDGWS